MPTDDDQIHLWFDNYQKPVGAIEVETQKLNRSYVQSLKDFIVNAIPSCYIANDDLEMVMNNTGLTSSEIVQNKLPDPGSVMAGDFGEILTLFYLASDLDLRASKIKKWRFKQDRRKPAPHSDVIILYRENDDVSSRNDYVYCAEAKVKSTSSTGAPIENSILGYESDKTGRLARTLVWLKEKAIDRGDADSLTFMKRFTENHLDVEFRKHYRAVAVIDCEFLDEELLKSIEIPPQSVEFKVIVIGIDNLKEFYQECFIGSVEVARDE
jgi:hypothetical protein